MKQVNTMMPEVYGYGGKLTGVFIMPGFAASVDIVLLKRSPLKIMKQVFAALANYR